MDFGYQKFGSTGSMLAINGLIRGLHEEKFEYRYSNG